jgi:hypothetical protein
VVAQKLNTWSKTFSIVQLVMKSVTLVLIELTTVPNVLDLVQKEVQSQTVQSLLPPSNPSMSKISKSDLLSLPIVLANVYNVVNNHLTV